MAKIKRNAPCSCGSGKKYKKCCLIYDEANAKNIRQLELANSDDKKSRMGRGFAHYDELDKISNSAVDLIREKKWKAAEKLCNRLLEEYPDQVDGLDRFSMLYDAMGEKEKAIEYYEKAAAFARNEDGFDEQFIQGALDRASELKKEMSETGKEEDKS